MAKKDGQRGVSVMKTIEVRRHAPSDKEKNVSPQGLKLAKHTIPRLRESYDACYCSPKKRTAQTLEAFGFPEAIPLAEFDTLPGDQVTPYLPAVNALVAEQRCELLEALLALDDTRAILEETAARVVDGLRKIAADLPEDGHALVVSHGGTIEPAIMLVRGEWNLAAMGGPLRECEGALFQVENGEIASVELDRFPGV